MMEQKRRSFGEKIVRAIVEERFGKTVRNFLKKIPPYLARRTNKFIGNIARRFISLSTKVNKNKIFFITFQGDYTCNPKYITEAILRQQLPFDLVWSARKTSLSDPDHFPDGVRAVNQYSYDMQKELASAKIIICNSVEFSKRFLPLKRNQILIQTWHGSLGIKRFDKKHNHGKDWVKAATYNGKVASFCISNSDFENKVYRETFWEKTPLWEFGHPRNDILVKAEDSTISIIKQKIIESYPDLDPDKKVVLYAPTFRDSHKFGYYKINKNLLLESLQERFGGEWQLLTRYHPTVRALASKYRIDKGIDVSSYPDMQELLLIADVGITDYSSWIFDFMLSKKPGFIFATDIKNYYTERGFYYPLETTPFPISTNNDELYYNIMLFDENDYEKKLIAFLKQKGCFETGNASNLTAEKIKMLMKYN